MVGASKDNEILCKIKFFSLSTVEVMLILDSAVSTRAITDAPFLLWKSLDITSVVLFLANETVRTTFLMETRSFF